MRENSLLLQPIKVGKTTLKNRIMFPPLTTNYEERDGSIGERSFNFYTRLAKGGVAYVTLGDVAPVRTASPTPKLYDDSQIASFRKLADALHEYDCKIGLQIFHPEYDVQAVGRMIVAAQMAMKEAEVAKANGDMATFAEKMKFAGDQRTQSFAKIHHDMTHFVSEASVEQLNEIKEAMVQCAIRADKAGIDAIEVHGDRLVGCLSSHLLNKRTDQYGGCLENRIRYAVEIVKALKAAVPDMMIEYKLPIITVNPDGTLRGKGGLLAEDAYKAAVMLEEAGVDMFQVAQADHTGNMGDTIPPMGTVPMNWTLFAAEEVKKLVKVPVATVGRVVTPEAGEEIIEKGQADIIGYGRSLLCDPDIANKWRDGLPVRLCMNCNKGCVDAIQSRKYLSCVLNAENGDEGTICIKPGEGKKNVAVIGGGVAGLEAARVAAVRGYDVTVFEKEMVLGGQLNLAAVPPRKREILRSVEYYEELLPQMGVKIVLGHEATAEELNRFDAAIVAVGAHNVILPVKGSDSDSVLSSWEVLRGDVEVSGKCVVIGGGLVGTETAEYLLEKGCDVAVVEMLDKVAAGESSTILPLIIKDFKEHGVEEFVKTKVDRIAEDGKAVIAINTETNEEVTIPCDYVVMAVGSKKNVFDETGITVPLTYVGDCSGDRTADISAAVRSGYNAANSI